MVTNNTIKFNTFGSTLGSRILGEKIRLQIEENIQEGQLVQFDFDEVRDISNSFADECFGKLLLEFDLNFLKQNTTFVYTDTKIKITIAHSLKQRTYLIQEEKTENELKLKYQLNNV